MYSYKGYKQNKIFSVRSTVINNVKITSEAQKDLRKLPLPIVRKFHEWVASIELKGLEEVRKISGYHDEPLRGTWKGYRSVRLNRAYRAFYRLENGSITFVIVEKVNKHEYKK